ncbi:MAG: ATP-dependent DNA helicase RecG [Dehalococcoidia bacterium]
MSAVQPADAVRLRRVFELERDRGCDNKTVMGGLDRMLIQMAEDGLMTPASALGQRFKALPSAGYRSMGEEERLKWIDGTISALGAARAAAPARPGLPARRKPAPARRPQARNEDVDDEAVASAPAGSLKLESPVTRLPGVGKAAAEKFEKLGVETAADAVFLFPRRFNDFTDVRKIRDLQPSAQPQTVVGTVFSVGEVRFGRRARGSQAVITDGSGLLKAMWWNMPYVARGLPEGAQVVLSGKVREYRGRLQMENPEFEVFDEETMRAGRMVPVYPATNGLGQRTIRRAVKAAVDQLAGQVNDPIPEAARKAHRVSPIATAIETYHYPENHRQAEQARQRLALGEFVAVQAAVLMRRAEWQEGNLAPSLSLEHERAGFLASLPFGLTNAQQRCIDEIDRDLRGPHPMLRLLQGDVGSGKTVVAFSAMLAAVRSGYQAALMAPTEILAEQHFRSLSRLLGGDEVTPLAGMFAPEWLGRPLRVLLLKGSLTASQKAQVRGDAAHGGADIVIGTHALLEDGMEMPRLGLAVVDEQHRFGVLQRAKLRQKGMNPHLLVMTATPIPRTLALTVYGDLEVSTIDEMPPGRKPIKTRWYQPHERDDAYTFLRKRLDAGEQAYVICPLVEESETLDVRSAEQEFEHLSQGPLRGYAVELLHGRMTGKVKDEVMGRFDRNEAQVLVSTSVIEVGIDVPNATVIVIEGAERFGLSQLHQFRGRVGRSAQQSYCLLFSTEEDPGPEARERLQAMCDTTDGFALAEVDLQMRGEGETWGRLQSGTNTMLRVARLTDREILLQGRAIAQDVLARDPRLQRPENYPLAAAAKPFLEKATEAN